MTVYVDAVRIPAEVPNGNRVVRGVWCHLVADSTAELLDLAARIGLRAEWLQHPGEWSEHFDVTEPKRRQAITAGAVELNLQQMGDLLNSKRQQLAEPTVETPRSTTCTWCGHEPHQVPCPRQIQLQSKPAQSGPCPCARHNVTTGATR